MKILIIGGTRFMGPFVARQLAAEDHEVTVFHRGKSPAKLPETIRVLHGDRRELLSHAEELQRIEPDVVVDMVAFTESDARGLGEVFRGAAGRLVVISSMDVYREYDRLRGVDTSPSDPLPLSEESPLRDQLFPYRSQAKEGELFYDYEKILIEKAVLADPELPATVLRLPAVYGPGDGQHRLFPYVKRMDDGRPAILLSEGQSAWRWTRGYVENVAAGIALAATDARAAGRVYNLGEENPLPEAGWVEAIGRAAGWSGTIVRVPDEKLPETMREGMDWSRHLVVSSERIRAELGYREIVSPEEALSRAIQWERDSPPPIEPAQFDYEAEEQALRSA
jgi:nucleoside-diphosphate-sugar epimerase